MKWMYIIYVRVIWRSVFILMTRIAVRAWRSDAMISDMNCLRGSWIVSKDSTDIQQYAKRALFTVWAFKYFARSNIWNEKLNNLISRDFRTCKWDSSNWWKVLQAVKRTTKKGHVRPTDWTVRKQRDCHIEIFTINNHSAKEILLSIFQDICIGQGAALFFFNCHGIWREELQVT